MDGLRTVADPAISPLPISLGNLPRSCQTSKVSARRKSPLSWTRSTSRSSLAVSSAQKMTKAQAPQHLRRRRRRHRHRRLCEERRSSPLRWVRLESGRTRAMERALVRGKRGWPVLVKKRQRWKRQGVQIGQTNKSRKTSTTRRAQRSSADPSPHLRGMGAGYRAGPPGSVPGRDLRKVMVLRVMRRGEIRWTTTTTTMERRMGGRRSVRECSAPSDSYRVKRRLGGGSVGGD